MDQDAVIDRVMRFRDALVARGVATPKIVLFGSWANGNPHPDSDIDLVVISESFRTRTYWERIELLSDAIYEIFAPIEATALPPEEWDAGDSIMVEYAQNGK